jgi:hypothetical protein
VTYKEFCEVVDEADTVATQAGPYTDSKGEIFTSALLVEKREAKNHVKFLLDIKTKVYASVSPMTVYISGRRERLRKNEWQLITP